MNGAVEKKENVMNALSNTEYVTFFEQDKPVKTLLYTEYESVMAGVVGLSEFSNKTIAAAYMIATRQRLKTVVLFLARFDHDGIPERLALSLRELSRYARPYLQEDGSTVYMTSKDVCQHMTTLNSLWSVKNKRRSSFLEDLNLIIAEQSVEVHSGGIRKSSTSRLTLEEADRVVSSTSFDVIENDEAALDHFPEQAELMPKIVPELSKAQRLSHQPPTSNQDVSSTSGDMLRSSFVSRDASLSLVSDAGTVSDEGEVSNDSHQDAEQKSEHIIEFSRMPGMFDTDQDDSLFKAGNDPVLEGYDSLSLSETSNSLSEKNEFNNRLRILETQYQDLKNQNEKVSAENDLLKKKIEAHQRRYQENKNTTREQTVHLLTKDRKLQALKEQYQELRNQNKKLMDALNKEQLFSSGKLSRRLEEYSVVLVHIHPIAGHISIRAQDFIAFIQDPDAFLAKYFRVHKDLYQAWMAHCKNPICQICKAETGAIKTLSLVSTVSEFYPGKSDRCEQHQNW